MGNLLDLFVFKYNRTDFHELNLDWIISDIKTIAETLKNFVSLNTIKYADPIQWIITSQYQANTVVIDENTGTAYLSTKPVPSGVSLDNTDYWTVIFDLSRLIANINQNLTSHDAGSSATATFPSDAGDWLLWNNKLYKVLSDISIGYAYVENGNIEAKSVESLVKEYVATAIEDAISDLTDITGDLSDLNTTDKSNIVSAINEVLDKGGIYNKSTPDSGLLTNIGLKEGVYNISEDTTINAQLVVPKGAVIDIDNGVTLTINGSIQAGLYQIFTGDGNVVITKESTVYPEWWGAVNDSTTDSTAAIQKAIASISKGVVLFQSGKFNIYTTLAPINAYVVSDTLVLNKNNVALRGVHRACIMTTAQITIDIEGISDNGALTFVQGHYIENIIFFNSATLSQPSGYNERICIKNHASIRNYIKFCEFYNFNTAYYSDTIVANYFINNTVHVPDFVYCTGIYLNDNIVDSAIYPNASQHIEDSIFLCGNSSVGITAIGDVLSDLFVRNNEFGGGYRSISLNIGSGTTSTPTSYDIHITDNIFDNIADTCIEMTFSENDNSAVIISRNWIAHRNNNAITLQKVHNANISDNIINGTLGLNTYGIALVYCKNITAKGNIFESCARGIDTAIGSMFVFTDNQFTSFDDAKTYEVAFRLTASVDNCFIGNNLINGENKTITNGVVVQGSPNIINWNIAKSAPDSIAAGNIVNGVTI